MYVLIYCMFLSATLRGRGCGAMGAAPGPTVCGYGNIVDAVCNYNYHINSSGNAVMEICTKKY